MHGLEAEDPDTVTAYNLFRVQNCGEKGDAELSPGLPTLSQQMVLYSSQASHEPVIVPKICF